MKASALGVHHLQVMGINDSSIPLRLLSSLP